MSTKRDLLTSRIILRAIFPVFKVLISDDPKINKMFKGVTGKVQFVGDYNGEPVGAALIFTNGNLEIEQGLCEKPDITFSFKTIERMNAMLAGKPAFPPKVKGWTNFSLLFKVLMLLLGVTILLPTKRPKAPEKKKLKLKLIIFMITTALSQYNKGGDEEMVAWTKKQPDRVYQFSVETEEDIAAYIRIKAGKSKAGRGFYKKKRPFVHFKFASVESAMPVLLNDIEFVQALAENYVTVEGSPEYGANLNNFMMKIQGMIS